MGRGMSVTVFMCSLVCVVLSLDRLASGPNANQLEWIKRGERPVIRASDRLSTHEAQRVGVR